MNNKELTYLFKHPTELSRLQTDELEKIIAEFPYFQSVRSLWLKGLKDQGSFRYNQALKTTAAYTTDRSVLFDFITSPVFLKNTSSTEAHNDDIEVNEPEEVSSLEKISIDDAVTMKIEEAEHVLNPLLFTDKSSENTGTENKEEKTEESFSAQELTSQISESEAEHPISESEQEKNTDIQQSADHTNEETLTQTPLEFDKKETHSFAEWLKLTAITPINRTSKEITSSKQKSEEKEEISETNTTLDEEKTSSTSETESIKKSKFELIDKFIESAPKIKPANKNAPARNLAKDNPIAPDELMTETLARVYLAQKNYKKAIQAYKILILKNPEKSGFFADQIRSIKNLQDNK
ncbi:hypothetical protein HN014_04710 [Aquimarina sp. TRL1]|uniref:hypothetical protein n=1 Tax=Aquimarina sp. (strain TRL1) TaxID=2736252 RepID=UPI00158B92DA|nr:hypothetical protein [Aquimarina sp. TRL1]QKX04239.1 hypothetical protein HN014_04710 [Aquimarina sp. TRL1]